MMSNYLQPHNRKTGGRRALKIKIVFLAAIIIVAARLMFPNAISKPFHSISLPAWKMKNAFFDKTASIASLLRSKQSLVAKNKTLKRQLDDLRADILSLSLIREENDSLKKLLGRETERKTTLAAILSRPNASPYDTFVVDIGSDYGVKKGDYVIATDDIVIGTVEKVFERSSVVKLFSAPGENTAVSIGPENIPAEAIGRGGGNFTAKVPRGVAIESGYAIAIPGINAGMFGVVEEIIASPTDPFQKIMFKNPLNITELQWVQIVKTQN